MKFISHKPNVYLHIFQNFETNRSLDFHVFKKKIFSSDLRISSRLLQKSLDNSSGKNDFFPTKAYQHIVRRRGDFESI